MLSRQDLDALIEAVEAWENKDDAGNIVESLMLSSMRIGDIPGIKEEASRKAANRQAEKKIRKERSIILRAKLLQIRDSLAADELFSNTSNHS